jgi:hypothetical protein
VIGMNFTKYIKTTSAILSVVALVLIVLGVTVLSANVYTGIIYIVVGGIQLLGAALLFPRIANVEEPKVVGNRSVQANWIVLSLGITGVALFLAPFFRLETMVISYIAFILCVVSVLLSAFNIFSAVKKVGARMVV